jgi:hypothetical protein
VVLTGVVGVGVAVILGAVKPEVTLSFAIIPLSWEIGNEISAAVRARVVRRSPSMLIALFDHPRLQIRGTPLVVS